MKLLKTEKVKSTKVQLTPKPNKPKAKKGRDNICAFIIGTNRTGKTTEARKFAVEYKKNNPENKVYAFDPQFKLQDVIDKNISVSNDFFEEELLTYSNALIIFDDYRILYQSNTTSKKLLELMCQRVNYNLDIIFICHSAKLVLERLTYYVNYYYVFYTLDKEDSWESKIPSYELCKQASEFITPYVRKNGRGTYPKFPFIIIDVNEEKLIGQNIDPKKIPTEKV